MALARWQRGRRKEHTESLRPPPPAAEPSADTNKVDKSFANVRHQCRPSLLRSGDLRLLELRRIAAEEIWQTIEAEPNWRANYEGYVVKVAEAGAQSSEAAIKIAEAGLAEIYKTFEFVRGGAFTRAPSDIPTAMAAPSASSAFTSGKVMGASPPSRVFEVPLDGNMVGGA